MPDLCQSDSRRFRRVKLVAVPTAGDSRLPTRVVATKDSE
jgi:hypothetical protein